MLRMGLAFSFAKFGLQHTCQDTMKVNACFTTTFVRVNLFVASVGHALQNDLRCSKSETMCAYFSFNVISGQLCNVYPLGKIAN